MLNLFVEDKRGADPKILIDTRYAEELRQKNDVLVSNIKDYQDRLGDQLQLLGEEREKVKALVSQKVDLAALE
jgi:hypothetical protein